jgi:hypothetical protein
MDGHNETDWESINFFSLKNFDVKSKEERERETVRCSLGSNLDGDLTQFTKFTNSYKGRLKNNYKIWYLSSERAL